MGEATTTGLSPARAAYMAAMSPAGPPLMIVTDSGNYDWIQECSNSTSLSSSSSTFASSSAYLQNNK